MLFKSVRDFVAWIEEHGPYSFSSPPRQLTQADINLYSAASGDFNPAHCRPEFAHHSKFKGIVSHGSGTIARGEGEFMALVPGFFDIPAEVIALGSQGSKYRSPLYLGDIYQYHFTLSNPRRKRDRWDIDVHIVCEVTKPQARVVLEYWWNPALVEHPELSDNVLNLLRPKSYWRNVAELFVFRPAMKALEVSYYGFVFGLAVVAPVVVWFALSGRWGSQMANAVIEGLSRS